MEYEHPESHNQLQQLGTVQGRSDRENNVNKARLLAEHLVSGQGCLSGTRVAPTDTYVDVDMEITTGSRVWKTW